MVDFDVLEIGGGTGNTVAAAADAINHARDTEQFTVTGAIHALPTLRNEVEAAFRDLSRIAMSAKITSALIRS